MNNRLYISLAGAMLLLVAMCGCIKNDLPYGKVPLSITAFSVSGQTGDAVISDKDLTVTVNFYCFFSIRTDWGRCYIR